MFPLVTNPTSELAPITHTTDLSDQSGGVAQEKSCWFAHRAANGGSFLRCITLHTTPVNSTNKMSCPNKIKIEHLTPLSFYHS